MYIQYLNNKVIGQGDDEAGENKLAIVSNDSILTIHEDTLLSYWSVKNTITLKNDKRRLASTPGNARKYLKQSEWDFQSNTV